MATFAQVPPRLTASAVAVLAGGLGIGAAFGGWGLLTDPVGLGVEEAWLDGSPFPDYTIPGLFLLVVIGGGMLGTAVAAATGSPLAAPAAALMGFTLALFLVIESAIVGYHGPEQIVLVLGTGLPALLLLVLGLRLTRRKELR